MPIFDLIEVTPKEDGLNIRFLKEKAPRLPGVRLSCKCITYMIYNKVVRYSIEVYLQANGKAPYSEWVSTLDK
ncbi:MAG: hypothetical protein C5B49_07405 [Bdellovibrio sp.]|nr:MAG: hypothetical protein C5B49_07405 [Bdellovibrio sp.]